MKIWCSVDHVDINVPLFCYSFLMYVYLGERLFFCCWYHVTQYNLLYVIWRENEHYQVTYFTLRDAIKLAWQSNGYERGEGTAK